MRTYSALVRVGKLGNRRHAAGKHLRLELTISIVDPPVTVSADQPTERRHGGDRRAAGIVKTPAQLAADLPAEHWLDRLARDYLVARFTTNEGHPE